MKTQLSRGFFYFSLCLYVIRLVSVYRKYL